jgi:MFS transporter, OFA family, oxalate/formate antiporter
MNERKQTQLGRMAVLASFLAVFVLFGYRSSFSMLLGPMNKDMGWSVSSLSMGYSLMMVIYAITAYFCGMVLDKWGTRPCFAAGAVFTALGFWITSMATTYLSYLIPYALFAGIGTGMLWVSSTVSVRKWYIGKNYGTMWGIAFAGAPLAQVILSLGLKSILTTMDWRVAMKVLAVVVFVALIIASLVAKKSPEHYGMTPIGEAAEKKDADSSEYIWSVKEAFSKYPIWGTIICFCTCVLSEFLVWTQVVNYWVKDVKLSLSTATYLYIVIGVCGIFTMPLLGIAADKIVAKVGNEAKGRKIMLMLAPTLGIIAILFLLLSKVSLVFAAIAAVIFAAYWAIEPGGCAGYAGSIFGNKSLGRIWGLATLIIMGIGPATGSFIGGYFYDLFGSYTNSLLFALGSFAVSLIVAMTLPLSCAHAESKNARESA